MRGFWAARKRSRLAKRTRWLASRLSKQNCRALWPLRPLVLLLPRVAVLQRLRQLRMQKRPKQACPLLLQVLAAQARALQADITARCCSKMALMTQPMRAVHGWRHRCALLGTSTMRIEAAQVRVRQGVMLTWITMMAWSRLIHCRREALRMQMRTTGLPQQPQLAAPATGQRRGARRAVDSVVLMAAVVEAVAAAAAAALAAIVEVAATTGPESDTAAQEALQIASASAIVIVAMKPAIADGPVETALAAVAVTETVWKDMIAIATTEGAAAAVAAAASECVVEVALLRKLASTVSVASICCADRAVR